MLIDIFKQRLEEIHRIDKEKLAQPKKSIKFKTNLLDEENVKNNDENKNENRHSKRLTLEYLIEELKVKFKKLS